MHQVAAPLPDADLSTLAQLNLVRVLTNDQYAQFVKDVENIYPTQQAIAADQMNRNKLAQDVEEDSKQTHSFLFHLEGKEKQAAKLQAEEQARTALQATTADLTARDQQFNRMVAEKSLLDTLTPVGNQYVGLTGPGLVALRDLGIRMYRVSDLPFAKFWEETIQVDRDLNDVALHGSQYFGTLLVPLRAVDRSSLWATSVGLAKLKPDVSQGAPTFLEAYARIAKISNNEENRLMSAEMLSSLQRSAQDNLPALTELEKEVHHLGVPKEASLGVASILLIGQRADGTFATANLGNFLKVTRSFESAALLAIVNRPFDELSGKFTSLRSMFGGWGFEPSEDVELSSAYLTISDLPAQGISTKLAIITKGMATYLQFPLVASSIMASIPVLEANETLNMLEQAYEIIGRRAMPLSQPELICLAVRMIHGIQPETVAQLDTTATAAPVQRVGVSGYGFGPGFFFLPAVVAYGAYFSTFSGMGGAHPGHAHFGGGGFVG